MSDLIARLREQDYTITRREAADRIEELTTEARENARIIGMSAEREMALRGEVERLRGALDDLLTFAKAIQTWRSDADSYDRECDHPQRHYCEDVELMEGVADTVVRRVTARAALEGTSHE